MIRITLSLMNRDLQRQSWPDGICCCSACDDNLGCPTHRRVRHVSWFSRPGAFRPHLSEFAPIMHPPFQTAKLYFCPLLNKNTLDNPQPTANNYQTTIAIVWTVARSSSARPAAAKSFTL